MVSLLYHVEKREIEKEYNEFCVLGTHMSVLVSNEEEIQNEEQNQYLIMEIFW